MLSVRWPTAPSYSTNVPTMTVGTYYLPEQGPSTSQGHSRATGSMGNQELPRFSLPMAESGPGNLLSTLIMSR